MYSQLPHMPSAAIADVRAALGLPEVMPDARARRGRRRAQALSGVAEVQDAVHLQNRRADVGAAAAAGRVAGAFAADDGRGAASAATAAAATAAAGPAVMRLVQASVRFLTFDWLIWVSLL